MTHSANTAALLCECSQPSIKCYPHSVCVATFFAEEMLHLQRINSWIRPLSVLAPRLDDDYYRGSIRIHGSPGQTWAPQYRVFRAQPGVIGIRVSVGHILAP